MRFPAWAALASTWLLVMGGYAARAQNAVPSDSAAGPSNPAHAQHVKPPKEAPHKAGSSAAGKIPVVPPHGPPHPHKPLAGVASGKSVAQPAPPVVPVQPPAETEAAQPQKLADPEKPDGTPDKLPRFASLRSDDVNMRAGPGTRYRIDWVYKRRDLPVEIEREFDVWRWVRDADGIRGWVHQATLMGRRDFIVQKTAATLRSDAKESAAAVAILNPGVIGRIRKCEAASEWCEVQTGSYRGYIRRDQIWGLLPNEVIKP